MTFLILIYSSMADILYDKLGGTITISDKFDITATASIPTFSQPGDEYTVSFTNLEGVSEFTTLIYDALGLTEARYLAQYYRISRDGVNWSEWLDLKRDIDNFPTVDSKDPLYLEVKWVRKGLSTIGTIRMLEYELRGKVDRFEDQTDGDIALLSGSETIIKPPYIFKVFRIDDVEIISSTGIPASGFEIKYRYSQDSGRTWSNWEPFTKENITTTRINPIRFFQIEYSIANNSAQPVRIEDINLIGDFQNVSKDYFKTNLYGIRECCQSNIQGYYDANGNFIPNTNQNGGGGISGSGGTCDSADTLPEMTSDEKSQLYNPYQQNAAVNLLNKLSADAEQIFGFRVTYFATDPDKKGQDHSLNEYQLYNVVCQGDIKVSVNGNNFPDSQIVMNQFDLNLFESMEVHITKKQFKEIFGPQRRPSKEDFLYFCDVNRMFQVDHAQQFRGFNNSSVYYKLILKKYSQKANVQTTNPTIQNNLKELTKNSTIEELFGLEKAQDKDAVANKQQYKPLTTETIRLEILAKIEKELIENSSTIISKSHYDLSSVDFGTSAVKYRNLNPVLKVSDNIGFTIWFNLNNYVMDEDYTLFSYYDTTNSLGWKAILKNDTITVTLNSTTYQFPLLGSPSNDTVALNEETWYCYFLNVDQRQRTLEQFIWKRDVDDEDDAANLTSTVLRQVYRNSQTITPVSWELELGECQLIGSDMKATNIRLFVDVIPEAEQSKLGNQYIIRDDSKYLVFADNATTRLYLQRFPMNE
jgi:hypothetical protein